LTANGYEPYIGRMVLERGNKFTLMLSDEEKKMLDSLAEAQGFDSSNYLRGLIRREAAAHIERGERKGTFTAHHRDPTIAKKRRSFSTKVTRQS